MKIGTYNIAKENRLSTVTKAIKRNRLDIVCVQGITGLIQLTRLLFLMGGYDCVSSAFDGIFGYRNAIFYRKKGIKLESPLPRIKVAGPYGINTSLCRGSFIIRNTKRKIEVVSVDFSMLKCNEKGRAVNLLKNNFDFLNIYVAGDFNMDHLCKRYENMISGMVVLSDCKKGGIPLGADMILTQKSLANKATIYLDGKLTYTETV